MVVFLSNDIKMYTILHHSTESVYKKNHSIHRHTCLMLFTILTLYSMDENVCPSETTHEENSHKHTKHMYTENKSTRTHMHSVPIRFVMIMTIA